jgi:hypothetical protein
LHAGETLDGFDDGELRAVEQQLAGEGRAVQLP